MFVKIMQFLNRHFILITTLIYFAAILITQSFHEYFRDEVRALTLATSSDSFLSLIQIKNEGHPILWFAILRLFFNVLNTPLALPIASITISLMSVIMFLRFSPFSKLLKVLFTFSVLPIYEYSVMARNYGISMFFIFLFASLYKHKDKYGWTLATCIGLLANTNAHSIFISLAFFFIWLLEENEIKSKQLDIKKIIFTLSLIGFSLITILPGSDNIVIDVLKKDFLDLNHVFLYFLTTLPPWHVIDGVFPGGSFFSGNLLKLITFFTFFSLLFGLRKDATKFMALFFVVASFAYLFKFLYPGSLRHSGLVLIFVLGLYWIKIDSDVKKMLHDRNIILILKYLLPIILIFGVFLGFKQVNNDISSEKSSVKTLAKFLQEEGLLNVILISEPDYLIEALPYYIPTINIFIPRENKYGNVVSWSSSSIASLDLNDIINTAIKLKKNEKKDVFILLGHSKNQLEKNEDIHYSYNKTLQFNEKSLLNFKEKTFLIKSFTNAINDENFSLYKLN
jgi:hypothetical protein